MYLSNALVYLANNPSANLKICRQVRISVIYTQLNRHCFVWQHKQLVSLVHDILICEASARHHQRRKERNNGPRTVRPSGLPKCHHSPSFPYRTAIRYSFRTSFSSRSIANVFSRLQQTYIQYYIHTQIYKNVNRHEIVMLSSINDGMSVYLRVHGD